MKKTFLRELRSGLGYMSAVEKRISEVILSDSKSFITYSLSELSEKAGVSQGSIINFANKFAGGGFPSLKMKVAAAISEVEDEKPFSNVSGSDTAADIFNKTADNICDALKNTAVMNDADTLGEVCEMILSAKKVEIYGVFRSAVVATDFYYQLLQLGIPASFVSDVLTCAVSASMLDRDSLVIAVSSSGQTQDVIDAVKLAKANGVPVVALTSYRSSPLAQLSDKVLVASPSGNSLSTSATEVRISQLALTDTICSYLISKIDADGNKSYYRMHEILKMHNVRD
ncbi:MAG: MurR/RpiR family transcriptional regulator [Clostridia bacterium]|nr:MurR/RpiR family transcriptional regulator [Clostridia bacterium]